MAIYLNVVDWFQFKIYKRIFKVEDIGTELVEQIVAAYRENSWLDFLRGVTPLVDDYVARFK